MVIAALLLLGWAQVMWAQAALANCGAHSLWDSVPEADRARMMAQAASQPYARGLHWVARKDTQTIHVIGTMHFNDPRFDALMAQLTPVIEAADLVLFETRSDALAAYEQALVRDPWSVLLDEPPGLMERLPEPVRHRLDAAQGSLLVPPAMINQMQPWFAFATMSVPACILRADDPKNGLDQRLFDLTERLQVPAGSLEEATTFQTLFSSLSWDDQADLLGFAIAGLSDSAASMVATAQSYFDESIGSIAYLAVWQAEHRAGLPRQQAERSWQVFSDLLLVRRNMAWIEKILARTERRIVVAVGGLHLPGEEGVLSLLAANGYTLERAPAWPIKN